MSKKIVHIDTLIQEYMESSKLITQSNEALLGCKKGLFNQKLKSRLRIAKEEHKNYIIKLQEFDDVFVGDLEGYMHSDLAHLAIKDTNYKVLSRARFVCFSNLERFEKTLVSIEDSLNFKQSIQLAWLSIGVASFSIIANFLGT